MKKILTALLITVFGCTAYAQNFEYGSVNFTDYNFDKNTLDSNANAIVLREFGTASLQIDDIRGTIELVFVHHVRIKIYNKDGFNQANIIIPLYKDDNREEDITDIKASTYNYVNDKLVETPMEKSAIFTENRSRYTVLKKFTLPNIKEGSIIEYTYRIVSPNLFNFKTWHFQEDIPKVHSEYLVYIPATYNYNVLLRGYQKLTDQKTELYKDCFLLNGVNINCSKITYTMKNIPAFIEEDNMTAPSNFKSAIYFELSDVQALNGAKFNYTKTWKDVDKDLTDDRRLGGQMKKKDVFKDIIPSIIKNTTDELSKANAVYNYIKKQIKWNNYAGMYSEDNIKKALDLRSGNIGDVNLSLIAALSAANLDVEAVILSTRENGAVNELNPVMSEFNYIIAKLNIGDKTYMLDASEPLLPFGLLPLRCLNNQGRVINMKKPSYWIDLKASQRTSTSYILQGNLNSDGKIVGKLISYRSGYAALNKRKEIKSFTSVDEYIEKLDERMTKIKILNAKITNIDSVENILTEEYEIEMAVNAGADAQFYFNPFFITAIIKNPYNLNNRTYPIDLGAASDERIVMQIVMPNQYKVSEKPKDMGIALPNDGGKYILKSAFEGDTFSMSQILQFNNAVYQADEYLNLKEFYSKIIQNQKTELLIVKN